MKQYQLFYKADPNTPGLSMIQLPAEDMWDFIEKVKEIYPNFKDQFDVRTISDITPTPPTSEKY